MSATTSRYHVDARTTREARFTSNPPRHLAFTGLTEDEARNITEFLLDRPVANLAGSHIDPQAAGALTVVVTELDSGR
jgi:hypothetical protein